MRVDLDNSAIERVALDARRETLTENGLELGIRCQANAPVLSGDLRDSHDVEGPDADATEVIVVAREPYAFYVHDGTRPHPIPNAFGWGITVQHPGYEGNPWMTRSIDEMSAENG